MKLADKTALAWSNLVDNHLQTGALVRPIDVTLHTDAQFCLLEPLGRSSRQSVQRFRNWLMEQVNSESGDELQAG